MTLSRDPSARQCELFRVLAVGAAVLAVAMNVWDTQVAQSLGLASITFALLAQYLPVYVQQEVRYQNVERIPFPTSNTRKVDSTP